MVLYYIFYKCLFFIQIFAIIYFAREQHVIAIHITHVTIIYRISFHIPYLLIMNPNLLFFILRLSYVVLIGFLDLTLPHEVSNKNTTIKGAVPQTELLLLYSITYSILYCSTNLFIS